MSPKPFFVTMATGMLLASCATPIHVDGVLVTGERQEVSESDVRAAVAALQAALPELKEQTLTRIRVAAADEILLTTLISAAWKLQNTSSNGLVDVGSLLARSRYEV